MASQKYVINQIQKEPRNQEVWSRRAYVDWVNKTLTANFTNTLEFRNGAAYIQLIDMLFPGIVPIEDVKFCAETQYDCYKNFRILEYVFKKLGINKVFSTDALSSGRHVESWAFLKWFKAFFDQNYDQKEYDPLKARNYAYMGFGKKSGTVETPKVHFKFPNKKLAPVRSKSVVGLPDCQDDTSEGKAFFSKKTCRSVECLIERKNLPIPKRPNSPVDMRNSEKESFNDFLENEREPSFKDLEVISLEQIPHAMDLATGADTQLEFVANDEKDMNFHIKANKNTNQDSVITKMDENKNISVKTKNDANLEDMAKNEKVISPTEMSCLLGRALILKTDGRPEENQEIKPEFKNNYVPHVKNSGESSVKSIVVNTVQQYEEFGVRVTENLQLKIESSSEDHESTNENTTQERQKKINLMIEKFLRYHWTERKEYFQTIADFLKEENKKAQR